MSDNSTFIKKYRPYRLTDFYTNDKFKQAVNTLISVDDINILFIGNNNFVGFNAELAWCFNIECKPIDCSDFKLADMKEVKALLIDESYKRGLRIGSIVNHFSQAR